MTPWQTATNQPPLETPPPAPSHHLTSTTNITSITASPNPWSRSGSKSTETRCHNSAGGGNTREWLLFEGAIASPPPDTDWTNCNTTLPSTCPGRSLLLSVVGSTRRVHLASAPSARCVHKQQIGHFYIPSYASLELWHPTQRESSLRLDCVDCGNTIFEAVTERSLLWIGLLLE